MFLYELHFTFITTLYINNYIFTVVGYEPVSRPAPDSLGRARRQAPKTSYLCPSDESPHRGARRKNGDEESPGNAEHPAS